MTFFFKTLRYKITRIMLNFGKIRFFQKSILIFAENKRQPYVLKVPDKIRSFIFWSSNFLRKFSGNFSLLFQFVSSCNFSSLNLVLVWLLWVKKYDALGTRPYSATGAMLSTRALAERRQRDLSAKKLKGLRQNYQRLSVLISKKQ